MDCFNRTSVLTCLRALLSVTAITLALSNTSFAAPDPQGFTDKHGRKHPGFSFRFSDKRKVGRAIRAQEKQFNKLMRKRGVVGSAIGWDSDGEPVIRVFSDGASRTDIPDVIDGFPVRIENSGSVYALKYVCRENNPNRSQQCPDTNEASPAAGGTTSTMDRIRPVPNGVSLGPPGVTAGTLGCIVSQGCHFLALSNNHVVGNVNSGNVGDLILQPGVFDGGIYPDDSVGTLFDWVNIVMSNTAFNRVDGALVLINAIDYTNETLPDGYGKPRTNWMTPQAGLNVMKYGRTTRYTEGVITGINAVVNVNYDTCCARFVGQLVVEPVAGFSDFALGGDSGSLLVARDGTNARRPVGLIFALANDGATFANPIDDVLNELNIDQILGEL